jgi:chromosome segregation ATPase
MAAIFLDQDELDQYLSMNLLKDLFTPPETKTGSFHKIQTEEFTTKISALESKIVSMQDCNIQLQQQIFSLKQQLTETENHKILLQTALLNQQNQYGILTTKIADLSHDHATTMRVLTSESKSKFLLQEEVDKKSAEIKSLAKSLSQINQEIKFLRQNEVYLNDEIKRLQSSLNALNIELLSNKKASQKALVNQSAFFTKKIKALTIEYEKQIADKDKIINTTAAILANDETILNAQTQKIKIHSAEIAKLMEEKISDRWKTDDSEYKSQIALLDLCTYYSTARTLEGLLVGSLVATKRSEDHSEIIHSATKSMENRIQNLSSELEDAFKTIAEQQKEIDRLTEENESLRRFSVRP